VKVLVLSEYPAPAAGLALQGELLCRGLSEMGVDVHPVHLESDLEKEWYYRWFRPDIVVGVGPCSEPSSAPAAVWNEGSALASGRWLHRGTP